MSAPILHVPPSRSDEEDWDMPPALLTESDDESEDERPQADLQEVPRSRSCPHRCLFNVTNVLSSTVCHRHFLDPEEVHDCPDYNADIRAGTAGPDRHIRPLRDASSEPSDIWPVGGRP